MNGFYRLSDPTQALNTDFLGGEASAAPFEGEPEGGRVWANVETDIDRHIDIPTFMGPNIGYTNYDYTVMYAFTYVYSPINQAVDIKLGIDDQAKVWLNESLVFTAAGNAGDFTINGVTLNQGWNKILVKAKNNTGGYGFNMAFTVPGQPQTPAPGLLFRTETPDSVISADLTAPSVWPVILTDSGKNAQISWQTSELSPTYLEHGTTPGYGTIISNTNKTVNHTTTVNSVGLHDSYYFKITATDLLGNTGAGEIAYPLIYDMVVKPTSTTVTVQWATYAPADTQVEWGTSAGLGQQTALVPDLVTDHSVVISGLNPNTTYYFRVKSRTADGTLFATDIGGVTASTYIRKWLVNGLYSTPDSGQLLTTDFLNGEQDTLPYERKADGDYTWAKVINPGDMIDISYLYPGQSGDNNNKAFYAHTYVYSPTPLSPFLSMGSDDGIRAWVNGNLVWSNDVSRGHTFNQDRVQVNLNSGWNRLLVKVKNGSGGYAFSARFTDSGGNPIDLNYQLDDPAQFTETTDVTPPDILNVKTAVFPDNKVRVEWVTDEAGSSLLEWGKDTSYGSSATSSSLTIKHWFDIGPLEANTEYYLRIKSTDYAVNTAVYDNFTIVTGPGTGSFIRNWLVNGVYSNADPDTRLTIDYLGGEAIAKPLDGEGTLAQGKNWTELNSVNDYVYLSDIFGISPDSIAYANIYINSDRTKSDHYLWLGTTGGVNVFLNGASIYSKNVSREHRFNEDIVQLPLNAGVNRLMLKLTPGDNGEFGFSARIAMINGNPQGISGLVNYQTQGDPDVAFTGYGELLQAYTGLDTGKNNVSIRTSYDLGRSWFPTIQLVSEAAGPALVKSGAKTALFYKKLVNGKWQVGYKITETDGSSWTDEVVLTNAAVSTYNVDAVFDSGSSQWFVFYSDEAGTLKYRKSSNLSAWSAEQVIPLALAPSSYPNRYPSFGVEKLRTGRWGLAYIEEDDSSYHYSKAVYVSSGDLLEWSAPSILMVSQSQERPSQVDIFEDDNGNLFAGIQRWKHWTDFNMYTGRSIDGGQSWSAPVQVDGSNSSWATEQYDPIGNIKLYYGKNGKLKEAYLLKIYDGPISEDNALGFGDYSGEEGFGVNPAIGNYSYQNEDIRIPGLGVPLNFTRSYNSAAATTDGVLGSGWTHNYNIRLSVGLNGIVNVSTEDGRTDTFVLGPDNSYIPFPGVFDKLVKNADGTWNLKRTNRTNLYFDTEGKITRITDKNGNTLTFTYDENKRLVKVTEAAGRDLSFSYDNDGHINTITDPAGRTTEYSYTGSDLTGYVDMAGNGTSYTYDGGHRITAVTDPRGHAAIRVTYNENGKVQEQEDALGNKTAFAYDGASRKTVITEGTKTVTQEYDGYFRLVKETDALGYTTTYTYDGLGNRRSVTNANGKTTGYDYDLNGNLTRTTDPLGNTIVNYYNNDSDLVSRTDPNGYTTRFEYDASGNLLKTNLPNGKSASYTYYPNGLPETFSDANGNTTTYSYDVYGYPAGETNALGHNVTYTYDIAGRRETVTDPLGNTTVYAYDDTDNLLTVTDPLGRVTVYEYDANGNKIRETNALDQTTVYGYNGINHLVTVTDAVYNTTTFEYDREGNRVRVTDALGGTTVKTYDDGNRLVTTTDANGNTTVYTYDGNDNMLTMTDALNNTTHFAYDALDRPVSVIDSLGRTTVSEYDANGNKTKETDTLGNTTLFTYDSMNNPVTVTDAVYRTTRYEYDGNNNKTKVIDAQGNITIFEYDQANRPVKETRQNLPADQVTLFEYDAGNRLIKTVHPGGVIATGAYDKAGNLIDSTNGRGYVTHYEYNALNQVTTVTDAVYNTKAITYDGLGRVSSETDWDGNTTTYEYDQLSRVIKITYPDLSTETFTYDAVGNKLTVTDGEGHTTTYTYDKLNRPATVTDEPYTAPQFTPMTRPVTWWRKPMP